MGKYVDQSQRIQPKQVGSSRNKGCPGKLHSALMCCLYKSWRKSHRKTPNQTNFKCQHLPRTSEKSPGRERLEVWKSFSQFLHFYSYPIPFSDCLLLFYMHPVLLNFFFLPSCLNTLSKVYRYLRQKRL